jgi:hypothetical protein
VELLFNPVAVLFSGKEMVDIKLRVNTKVLTPVFFCGFLK